ncbi:MAG: 2-oxo acid dehydrogenase subunit E2 [Fuerstiella sp.]
MAIEFKLPEVSEGVNTVDIAEIMVSVGDTITAGTIVFEVETDKAVAEIECPHAGKITEILVSVGDSVAVDQVTLKVEAGDSAAAPTPEPTAPVADSQPAAAAPPASVTQETAAPSAPQTIEFKLPEVSEGVDTVDVAEILVAAGDTIAADAVVLEVETDKAVAEINCPHAGTVKAVAVAVGDAIAVGAVILTIETSASAATSAPSSSAPAPVATKAEAGTQPEKPTPNSPATAPRSVAAQVPSTEGRAPAPAGPATRRMARKLGVDLYQVQGSANGGRITIEDIEAFVRNRMTAPATPSGGGASLGIAAAAPLPDFTKFGPIEKQPLGKIFRSAASNLSTAWVTIPHVTQHNVADITELESARKRYVKDNPKSPKITMTAIMIKAVVGALRAYPKVNSSIDMESGELILKHYYNIGVAVDTPNGLVVPVIRNCDQKNVLEVADELTAMALKARDRKLKNTDMQGASFTITNLGGIGGTYFTPIVNPPEVAILGMSRGQKTLQLDDDGNIEERLMLPLSMSYDHRAINGADAARFIVKLSGSLTNFFELF